MRLLALALLAVVGWPSAASAGARVVLMPVSNLSQSSAATREATRQLTRLLPRSGYDVVMGEPVERILKKRRIRYLESVPPDLLDALLADFDATGVVFSTVLEYGERSPSAAVSARIVGAGGRTLGTAIAGLTPDDTTGPLGLGRVDSSRELLERVVEDVVASLPRPGQVSERDPSAPARPRTGAVWTYRSPTLERGKTRRVCVLPLVNATDDRLGARVVADLLNVRLRGLGPLEAIPPAELRAALRAEGIHSLFELDPDRMRALGRRLGTPLFLRGALRDYRASPASLELELSAIDAEKGRVVWTSYRKAAGTEYRGLLELGTITSAAVLADQVIAEMLEALSRA